MQPLRSLTDDISRALASPKPSLFACFIDFKKAFDTVEGCRLMEKLCNIFQIDGHILSIIRALLQSNYILIDDGATYSEQLVQNLGVIQEDSLSPTLFILYVADLAVCLRSIAGLSFLFFADDLVVYSPDRSTIQAALDQIDIWCGNNSLQVNASKTKVMKFRKGGRLAAADKFTMNNQPIEIVKQYQYLGIMLQSSLTFTQHIKIKKEKCHIVFGATQHLREVSFDTAMGIFAMKICPIMTYGFQILAPYFTTTQLKDIDTIKAHFLKHIMNLSQSTSNTLCYLLSSTTTLIEDLCGFCHFDTEQLQQFFEIKFEKYSALASDGYLRSPALVSSGWKSPKFKHRHLVTRLSAHGFHHLLCRNPTFHSPDFACVCTQCGLTAEDSYHILTCTGLACYRSFILQKDH